MPTKYRFLIRTVVIMVMVSVITIGVTAFFLYRDELNRYEKRLLDKVESTKRGIIAFIQHSEDHKKKFGHKDHGSILTQTIHFIRSIRNQPGFRGEMDLVIGFLEAEETIRWVCKEKEDPETLGVVSLGASEAVPMQLALTTQDSGIIRAEDYAGIEVLAAYTYVSPIEMGIVAKIKLADIQYSFIKGAGVTSLPVFVVLLLAILMIYRFTYPIITKLEEETARYKRLCYDQDILDEDLRESEHRFRCFFNGAFEGLAITKNGKFIDCNKQIIDLYGYSEKEFIGMKVSDLVHPEDLDLVMNNMQSGYDEIYQHRSFHKNGALVEVEVRGQETHYKGETVRITAIHDITEKKRALRDLKVVQDRDRQALKMEAIGNFAAGIAHDFNNALSPIIGYAELLSFDCKGGHKNEIENILKAAQLASKLVHQIQSFTKSNNLPLTPVVLNSAIEECFEFLRSALPSTVKLKLEMPDPLEPVMVSEIRAKQLLMNLCKNSAQAMLKETGTIIIIIKNCVYNEKTFDVPAGSYVRIEVVDDGQGMSPRVLEQALDPYFTTGNPGESSGIGLSVVHGIIESCDAHIHLYSEEDTGTRVIIYIPVIEEHAMVIKHKKETTAIVPGNQEHILVVDDEKYMIDVVGQVLRSLNYKVTTFDDSMAAWNSFRENPKLYKVIVSDSTMPVMTGVQLIQNIKSINPDVIAVLCSGLGSNYRTEISLAQEDIDGFLTKPATREMFAHMLTKLLNEKKKI